MTNKSLSKSDTTDMSSNVTTYTFSSEDTSFNDYTPDWSKWNGYYKKCPELKAVIDKKAMWTIGKGFKSSAEVKAQLAEWKGNGKDTADDIFENLDKCKSICGDSFAEIVRASWKDKPLKDKLLFNSGKITNLKPLNSGTIQVRSNKYGVIKEYIQFANQPAERRFKPDEIFHLQFNRIGDNNHGTSSIEAVEEVILALAEAKADLKIVFHRYVKPLLIASVDTDDASEITDFKNKMDRAVENCENMVIPKGTVDKLERFSIPQFSTLDPLPWIKNRTSEFIRSEGVPDIILGLAENTSEASSKMLYLAFEQLIEHNQNYWEKQIKSQLGLDIEFEFPASIEPDLKQNQSKDKKINNMETGTGQNT